MDQKWCSVLVLVSLLWRAGICIANIQEQWTSYLVWLSMNCSTLEVTMVYNAGSDSETLVGRFEGVQMHCNCSNTSRSTTPPEAKVQPTPSPVHIFTPCPLLGCSQQCNCVWPASQPVPCTTGNATSSSGVESLMIVCLVVGAAVVILVVAVGVTLMVVMAKRKRKHTTTTRSFPLGYLDQIDPDFCPVKLDETVPAPESIVSLLDYLEPSGQHSPADCYLELDVESSREEDSREHSTVKPLAERRYNGELEDCEDSGECKEEVPSAGHVSLQMNREEQTFTTSEDREHSLDHGDSPTTMALQKTYINRMYSVSIARESSGYLSCSNVSFDGLEEGVAGGPCNGKEGFTLCILCRDIDRRSSKTSSELEDHVCFSNGAGHSLQEIIALRSEGGVPLCLVDTCADNGYIAHHRVSGLTLQEVISDTDAMETGSTREEES